MKVEKMPENAQDIQGGTCVETKSAQAQVWDSSSRATELSRIRQILICQVKGMPPTKELAVLPSEPRYLAFAPANGFFKKFGFDGRIVYDRNTASFLGLRLPFLLDMVGDSAKSRLLNVLSFACIFSTVILVLSSFVFVSPRPSVPAQVCCFSLSHYLRLLAFLHDY
jgi:hypothetical protein